MKQSSNNVYEVQPHEIMIGLIDVIRETQERIGYYEMKRITKEHLDKNTQPLLEKKAKQLSEQEIASLAAKLYNKLMMKSTIQALAALSNYHSDTKAMTKKQLLAEVHQPKRLSRHIKATGISRPPNVATHAVVSGTHPEARAARKILAKFKIRIDDPDNGVFLPRDARFIPHEDMPDAADHSRIHTDEYYINITNILNTATSELECRLALRLIAKQLREGTMRY